MLVSSEADQPPSAAVLFQALFQESQELILVVDDKGHLVQSSEEWSRVFGAQRWLSEFLEESSVPRLLGALSRQQPWKRTLQLDLVDREGKMRRLAFSRTRLPGTTGVSLLMGRELRAEQELLSRIVELRKHHHRTAAELRRLANTDPLTGVANRREVWRNARWIWGHAQTATIALVDIDKFKRINDIYGHEAGDKVLQAIAEALSRSVGTGSVLGRWGGEEFVAVFEGDATERAEGILQACRNIKMEGAPVGFKVTVSLGMAVAPDTNITIADALAAADAAMYTAKEAGGDRTVLRHLQPRLPGLTESAERRISRMWKGS